MIFSILPLKRVFFNKNLPPLAFFFFSLLFSLIFFAPDGYAQQTKLSLADIVVALRSKKVTIAERNQIVAKAVKQRGVTFPLTPEIEKELQTAGADYYLIEAIRKRSSAVKPTLAPTPKMPDWVSFQNQANAFFVRGDFDAASAYYTKVIEINGKDALIYLSRGLAFYNKRDYESAIADYDKAIELNPKDSKAYFKRGDAFEKLGKLQNAIEDYQKAVDIESGNEPAKSSPERD